MSVGLSAMRLTVESIVNAQFLAFLSGRSGRAFTINTAQWYQTRLRRQPQSLARGCHYLPYPGLDRAAAGSQRQKSRAIGRSGGRPLDLAVGSRLEALAGSWHLAARMTRCRLAFAVRLALGWVAGLAAAPAPAAPPRGVEEVQPYLRRTQTHGVVALEVALRRLAPVQGAGADLWLVAVTHLGSSNYYATLQRFLDAQPLVLYEAIRHGTDAPTGPPEGYSLQADLARALGLTFQLTAIRYDRPHFRNSDLSLAQLTRLFESAAVPEAVSPAAGTQPAGPPAGAVEFGALVQIMNGEGLLGGLARLGVSLLAASPRLQAASKLALIETLGGLPNDLSQIEGLPPGLQRLMRILIEERNETVVRDARAALVGPPPPASVAIFYGAGHMADLEYRLCRELNYQPVEDRWLVAFDVDPRAAGLSPWELELTTRLVRAQMRALQRPSSGQPETPPAPEAATASSPAPTAAPADR